MSVRPLVSQLFRLALLVLATFVLAPLSAQYISMEPFDPSPDDTVIVTFDAKLGNEALADYDGPVFLRLAAIQGDLATQSAPRYRRGYDPEPPHDLQMSPIGDRRYRIAFVPRRVLGMPPGEDLLQLVLSFRNESGTQIALNPEGQVDILPGLNYLANHQLDKVSGRDAEFLGEFVNLRGTDAGVLVEAEGGNLYLEFFPRSIVRVSQLNEDERRPPAPSLGLTPVRPIIPPRPQNEPDKILFDLGGPYRLEVARSPVRLRLLNGERELWADAGGTFIDAEDDIRGLRVQLHPDEKIYGTGSRALPLDRRGYRFPHFHTAVYGYGPGEPQLNVSLPYVYSSRGAGLLLDVVPRGYFDIGKSEAEVFEFGSRTDDGISYYLLPGDRPDQVQQSLALLAGRQPLPPLWALGYIQSRYGYESQAELERITDSTVAAGYPIDAVVLDYYWYGQKDEMGDFAWEAETFPQPDSLIARLHRQDIKLIAITQPYVVQGSFNWRVLDSLGFLAKNRDGNSFVIKDFWAGPASLLDVFNPAARDWLWKRYRRMIRQGIDGIWVDLVEPENHPFTMRHAAGMAEDVHNIYPQVWDRMLHDRFTEAYPEKRFFNLTRSGFIGMQRYATFPWSGDVGRNWASFSVQPSIMLSMGLCGVGYMHSDLGGFAGGEKNAELYLRWLQFGMYNPIARTHGAADVAPSEPIYYDAVTQRRARTAIQERYRMLPYLYTLAYANTTAGHPLVRPLFYAYPDDPNAYASDSAFLLGPDMLVRPVLRPKQQQLTQYLPGGSWVELHEDRAFSGGREHTVDLTPDRIPVWVRAGAVIPMMPAALRAKAYTFDTMEFHWYLTPDAPQWAGRVYHDDGEAAGAENLRAERVLLLDLQTESGRRGQTLRFTPSGHGNRSDTPRDFFVCLHNAPERVRQVRWNGKKLKAADSEAAMRARRGSYFRDARGRVWAHVAWDGGKAGLEVR